MEAETLSYVFKGLCGWLHGSNYRVLQLPRSQFNSLLGSSPKLSIRSADHLGSNEVKE